MNIYQYNAQSILKSLKIFQKMMLQVWGCGPWHAVWVRYCAKLAIIFIPAIGLPLWCKSYVLCLQCAAKVLNSAVLERWLLQQTETQASFVLIIFTVLLGKVRYGFQNFAAVGQTVLVETA